MAKAAKHVFDRLRPDRGDLFSARRRLRPRKSEATGVSSNGSDDGVGSLFRRPLVFPDFRKGWLPTGYSDAMELAIPTPRNRSVEFPTRDEHDGI